MCRRIRLSAKRFIPHLPIEHFHLCTLLNPESIDHTLLVLWAFIYYNLSRMSQLGP
jgi:hypothetical protein